MMALQDPVKGHELQIILMGPDSEMRDARESFLNRLPIRNENIGRGLMKMHGYSSSKLMLMVYPLEPPIPAGTGAILITLRAASSTD